MWQKNKLQNPLFSRDFAFRKSRLFGGVQVNFLAKKKVTFYIYEKYNWPGWQVVKPVMQECKCRVLMSMKEKFNTKCSMCIPHWSLLRSICLIPHLSCDAES